MRISDWSSDVCSSDLMDAFETSASRVTLSKAALAQRLLLCLYGLGTNAGPKRVAGATPDVSYEELLHVHRRFIHAPALREACARVANATLAIRNAAVWGDAGTACARSEKGRGGKACVHTCRARWARDH